MITYQRLTDSLPDKFRMVTRRRELESVLEAWQTGAEEAPRPVGLVPLMEGADGIRTPAELEEWFELGLRLIGLAWVGTRYSGGWREPGPLTEEGRATAGGHERLSASRWTSVTWTSPPSWKRSTAIPGPIAATHGNCLALLPDFPTNRQFSDRVLEGVIERDGVVGVVPYNGYLKVGWVQGTEPPRGREPGSGGRPHRPHLPDGRGCAACRPRLGL